MLLQAKNIPAFLCRKACYCSEAYCCLTTMWLLKWDSFCCFLKKNVTFAVTAGVSPVRGAGQFMPFLMRIRIKCAGHAAHIGLPAGKHVLGLLGLIDAPGDKQRDAHFA